MILAAPGRDGEGEGRDGASRGRVVPRVDGVGVVGARSRERGAGIREQGTLNRLRLLLVSPLLLAPRSSLFALRYFVSITFRVSTISPARRR